MRVLVWKEKHGDVLVAARDPGEEGRAWLYLFVLMDGMQFYDDLDGDEIDAYEGAQSGDAKSAKWLLSIRGEYEYERVTVEGVIEP